MYYLRNCQAVKGTLAEVTRSCDGDAGSAICLAVTLAHGMKGILVGVFTA